jgi:RIO kinase 2
VPRPVDQNRHAVVMERLDGVELARTKLESEQVQGVCELILDEVATAYEAGYVHADMSEYNIFIDSDGVTVFDWPQAVSVEHENSHDLLTRDVENVLGYFERKYPGRVELSASSVVEAIVSGEFSAVKA